MRIGLMDSGVGGITVLYRVKQLLPDVDILYYADIDHVPYGTKNKEEITCYVDEAITFFMENKADAVLIACNTATSVAAAYVRSKYKLPIIGMEPAVKPALEHCDGKPILLMATPVTIHEEKLRILLEHYDNHHLVTALEMPELVNFAERSDFNSEKVLQYIKKQVKQYDNREFSAIVFGCTHFGYFKKAFQQVIPGIRYYADGGEGTAKHLKQVLMRSCGYLPGNRSGTVTYFESGRPVTTDGKTRMENYLKQAEISAE